MKKRDLILGLGILSAFSMWAASPYQGSTAPEAEGDFYLYQVESGLWIQNNVSIDGIWTTHAVLAPNGFNLGMIPVEGGYRIDPKEGGNNSLNASNLYMDTPDPVSVWALVPVTVDGVSNAFNIQAVSGPEVDTKGNFLLGEKDGVLNADDTSVGTTWQLVSRADRLAYAASAVANGEVSLTWAIPGNDFGRNDRRNDLWTLRYNNDYRGGVGHDGMMYNAVREAWHRIENYEHFITIEGVPNGTYKMRVQGFYRDYNNDDPAEEVVAYINAGQFDLRAKYYANEATGTFRHITSDPSTTENGEAQNKYDGLDYYLPNSMRCASKEIAAGKYVNEWIEFVVTDGKIVLGVEKREGSEHDWLIYDNFELAYVSASTDGKNVTTLAADVDAAIAEAASAPATTPAIEAAIAAANAAKAANDGAAMRQALLDLHTLVSSVKASASAINSYNATKEIALALGADITKAESVFTAAQTKNDFNNALKEIRFARRLAVAERAAAVPEAQPVAPGKFYLYNLGQKQYLSGGSDWGAHAALSLPGVEITLEEASIEDNAYHINSGLENGAGRSYLTYRGYMDGDMAGAWKFVPVEGKENVYNILQNDYQDVYVAWNPYASCDQGNADETTVGTENRNMDPNDLNAQWILVTREQRTAMMDNASLDNPVDASFFLNSPNFSQRENANTAWSMTNFSIENYGSNRNDFCANAYNPGTDVDINQIVSGLPAGVYALYVNGFYRNGSFADQANNERASNYYLYAGDEQYDKPLMNILECANTCPGEGNNTTAEDETVYNIPDNSDQATAFFKAGQYKNYTVTETDGSDLTIGVLSYANVENEWCAIDRFRLFYYGNNTNVDAVNAAIEAASGIENVEAEATADKKFDGRIFNLQGIQVTNPTAPGIYIQNGKKFIVR